MPHTAYVIVLLLAVAALARLAGVLKVPYPVLLVIGGTGIGLVPGAPRVQLDPRLVLLIFLPPLVYHAAFLTSPRELRHHARDIGLLAIGLVLATMFTVAIAVHELVGHLSWAEAFALGAIVAPTDPVASTTIFRRLGAPERLTTVVEGEALINDGTALVAFKITIAAVATGAFSAGHAMVSFVETSAGGVALGLVVGWLVKRYRSRLDDAPVEILISLITPYLAYLPADALGLSGVLAAVSAGLYLAYQIPTGLFHPAARLQAFSFWEVLEFVLNSALFVLVGLQVRPVIDRLGDRSTGFLLGAAAIAIGVVLLTRLLALVPVRGLGENLRERTVIAWSGMRGAVSLAAALSVPLAAPGRPLIIYLTFAVILATLVGQGITLPAVVRRLVPECGDEGSARMEESARVAAARAALERLKAIESERTVPPVALEHARRRYEIRLEHLTERDEGQPDRLPAAREVLRELLGAERETLERLHADGEIDQGTARRLERELDLEEERWDELEASAIA